jgi:hypothetical protein
MDTIELMPLWLKIGFVSVVVSLAGFFLAFTYLGRKDTSMTLLDILLISLSLLAAGAFGLFIALSLML